MAKVFFTAQLKRFVECECSDVRAANLREALEAVFDVQPHVRHYVLDEQGRLRQHVTVFIDGEMLTDRIHLGDAVNQDSEIYVMQALSGG